MSLIDQYNLATGARDFLNRLQGAVVHAAVAVAAETVNEVQTLHIAGTATGGTFTLTYAGNTTATIAWNATAAAVQTALAALASIGAGNVVCTGGPLPGTDVVITFTGTLGSLPLNLIT